jgi:hypothetical protein
MTRKSSSILYFEREGRENLAQVVRVIKRLFRKTPAVRSTKIIIFTALGEGPALAYHQLSEYDPQIIAVTFPPGFCVRQGEEIFTPEIHPKVQAFFDGVGVKVVRSRLPFDEIQGARSHNEQVTLIRDTLSLFGGGFSLAVQAVLQACDSGLVMPGEKVIAASGDCAAMMTAASTARFLAREGGLIISEILCKPRNFTITRRDDAPPISEQSGELFGTNAGKVVRQEKLPRKGPASQES